jgi:hypothetical protein
MTSCDLRTALAAVWVAKSMGLSARVPGERVRELCRDLVADVALVRASLPRTSLHGAGSGEGDARSLGARNAELERQNRRLLRALARALPRAVKKSGGA